MADKLTKQAAEVAGNALDKVADLVTKNANLYGIDPRIAEKFAYQCDLISDHIAKRAGVSVAKLAEARLAADEDPDQIGEEKAGPHQKEQDEPYMEGEFTQQEHRELREKVEDKEISPSSTSPEPQKPQPGAQVKAAAEGLQLANLFTKLHEAAAKYQASDSAELRGLGNKLASAGLEVLNFQSRLIQGIESRERYSTLSKAASHVVPHLDYDVPESAASKLAHMVHVMTGVAKANG